MERRSGISTTTILAFGPLLLLAMFPLGCASHGRTTEEEIRRQDAQRQQALLAEMEAQQPTVLFRGDIRNPRVPWREGLTLAEALLAAQYTWNWDPRTITVFRAGQAYPVNPKHLLRGQENPPLEPGDIVEVRH